MFLNCGVGEDSWESLGLQVHPKGDQFWVFIGRTDVEAETPILWPPDCEELTHWKRPWCWERLRAGGEGDDRGWDGWTASSTRWTWVWVDSGSWWWTGRPGVLLFMGSQRIRHNWATKLRIMNTTALRKSWKPASEESISDKSAYLSLISEFYMSLFRKIAHNKEYDVNILPDSYSIKEMRAIHQTLPETDN